MEKKIVVGLLSHYFKDSNLGCTALSICNVVILDKVAQELGLKIEYKILVNEKQPQVSLDFTKSEYEYRVYSSTKQTIKHPVRLLKTKIFNDCDIIFNLCAGDGFTDIYGIWRIFSESYMTILAKMKKVPVVLAPQTIGPFDHKISRFVAKVMMNSCKHIFTRDALSYRLCCEMGQQCKTTEVIDVALALPYEKIELVHDKFNLGINISGLLYNDISNRFGLSIDYKKFIHELIEFAISKDIQVHLISHVLIPDGEGEDDYAACAAVHKRFPDTILVEKYELPIDIKGYIAGLDFFVGARMHATIAAISSGVPVVPIAYSRKVNGLYKALHYPYYIDAKDNSTTEESALLDIINDIKNISLMKADILKSQKIYQEELLNYHKELKNILSSLK